MKKPIIVILFMLVLFSFIVAANTEFVDYGFALNKVRIGDTTQLWGSNQPQGTFSKQNLTLSVASKAFPIIADIDFDDENEIIFFSSGSVLLYNSLGNFIGSYTPVGGVLGRYTVANVDSDTDYEIVGLINSSGNFSVVVLDKVGNSLVLSQTRGIQNRTYQGIVYNSEISDQIIIPDVSYNFTALNIKTDTETFVPNFNSNMTQTKGVIQDLNFQNTVIVGDIDKDNQGEVLVASNCKVGALTCPCMGIYDLSSAAWQVQDIIIFNGLAACSQFDSLTMGTGVIGADTGVQSITATGHLSSVKYDVVMNLGGTQTFTDSTSVSSFENNVAPMIVDVNQDGFNEICIQSYTSPTGQECYDSTFTKKGEITRVATVNYQHAIGSYEEGLMHYIDFNRMYELNTTVDNDWHTTIVYNFGSVIGKRGAIPVSIQNRNSQVKDLLVVGNTSSFIYFSDIVGAAVCGNDICEIGENALNCFADCGTSDPTQAVLTSVQINPCYTEDWRLNTSVEVSVIAETVDSADVRTTVEFIQSPLQTQNATSGFISSGLESSFVFNANQTTNVGSIIVTAITSENSVESTLQFDFNVATTGVEFGDSSCGIVQPLEVFQFPDALTTDLEDNSITSGVAVFASMTNLGMNVIWLIIMGLAVFFILSVWLALAMKGMHVNADVVLAFTILSQILLLVIGTLLGFLSTGVIIVLVILGIVGISWWIRNQLASSNNGQGL